jgi:hypothetical protein
MENIITHDNGIYSTNSKNVLLRYLVEKLLNTDYRNHANEEAFKDGIFFALDEIIKHQYIAQKVKESGTFVGNHLPGFLTMLETYKELKDKENV